MCRAHLPTLNESAAMTRTDASATPAASATRSGVLLREARMGLR